MASVAVSASGAASGGQQGQSHDSDAASIDWDTTPVLSWMHPVFTGRSIIARGGHASTLVGNLMITFGGHYFGKEKFEYCNDVWAVDLDTMTWHNPTCSGRSPGPRYGHTLTVVDYKVYIFGGRGPAGLLHNDLWCLDVETWKWTLMPSTTAPPLARFNHTAAAVGNKVAFFGGWDGTTAFNDLWVYDISGRTWLKPKVRGMLPKARHGHSMVLAPSGRMIVHGGWAPTAKGFPEYLRDTRVFDTGSMMWIRPRISGQFPPASFSHAAVMVGRFMVVMGGYAGHKPKPASAAAEAALIKDTPAEQRGIQVVPDTLDSCPPPVSKAVGPDGQEVPVGLHPHVWVLDTDSLDSAAAGVRGAGEPVIRPNKRTGGDDSAALTMEWTQPFIAGQPPGKRYGHTLVAVGPHVLALGGWDGNKAIADVLQLDLTALVGPSLMMELAGGGEEPAEGGYHYDAETDEAAGAGGEGGSWDA